MLIEQHRIRNLAELKKAVDEFYETARMLKLPPETIYLQDKPVLNLCEFRLTDSSKVYDIYVGFQG